MPLKRSRKENIMSKQRTTTRQFRNIALLAFIILMTAVTFEGRKAKASAIEHPACLLLRLACQPQIDFSCEAVPSGLLQLQVEAECTTPAPEIIPVYVDLITDLGGSSADVEINYGNSFANLRIVTVIEIDSLPNLITPN
jgi:hypothetical protein